jgi:hypothetical protein
MCSGMQAQKGRSRAPQNTPRSQELQALTKISEQVAVPLDQLARFLATNRQQAEELVTQLQSRRFAKAKTYLAGESAWVWLTKKGSAQVANKLPARCYEPDPAYLSHRRAVNESVSTSNLGNRMVAGSLKLP